MDSNNFILNNSHRKYMGLKLLKEDYELMKFKGEYEEYYLYICNNKIKKIIYYFISDREILMNEADVDYEINQERTMVLPKTNRGKPRILNLSTIKTLNGQGNYFTICAYLETKTGYAIIGNYTNQRTFYYEEIKNYTSLEHFKNWCDKFVENSNEQDLKEVEDFSKTPRKHIKYQEGDYFRVKIGKNIYTYGRIIMDIYKRKIKGMKYWDILMGRPLIIEIFYILTDQKDITCEELSKMNTLPSQYIQDNRFYYGEYEIIGQGSLPSKVKYPIMYGKSISYQNPNKIYFQCGEIYREINYQKDVLISRNDHKFPFDFKNNGVGFSIKINIETLKRCIKENSELPYWENSSDSKYDLRSPENKEYLHQVLKQFNLTDLLEIYNN